MRSSGLIFIFGLCLWTPVALHSDMGSSVHRGLCNAPPWLVFIPLLLHKEGVRHLWLGGPEACHSLVPGFQCGPPLLVHPCFCAAAPHCLHRADWNCGLGRLQPAACLTIRLPAHTHTSEQNRPLSGRRPGKWVCLSDSVFPILCSALLALPGSHPSIF